MTSPAAHTNNDIVARHAPLGETPTQILNRRQCFCGLTGADHERPLLDAGLDNYVDAWLGHDRRSPGRAGDQSAEFTHHSLADQNVVAAIGELDRDDDHTAELMAACAAAIMASAGASAPVQCSNWATA